MLPAKNGKRRPERPGQYCSPRKKRENKLSDDHVHWNHHISATARSTDAKYKEMQQLLIGAMSAMQPRTQGSLCRPRGDKNPCLFQRVGRIVCLNFCTWTVKAV